MDGVTDLEKTLDALTAEYRALHEALRMERRRLAEVVLQLGPGTGGSAAIEGLAGDAIERERAQRFERIAGLEATLSIWLKARPKPARSLREALVTLGPKERPEIELRVEGLRGWARRVQALSVANQRFSDEARRDLWAAVDLGLADVAGATGYGPSGSPDAARPSGSVVRERA